ncbi:hypothetical protein PHJA_001280800 [Phtheirospermum japonicum]|uniref:Uncharacterized protein n=1 Tax=Phtheirospermum japonicum TaxID=374723 RepID=A0A830C2L5_9LAMI|nr:hypothetical protein PHJA_001280800 [Phtheirospermum japonicum]
MYYSTDKPSREEDYKYKPRKPHRNTPSFSSTLLDEIYNSIDGSEQKANGLKMFDEKPLRKQSNFSNLRDEESTAKVKVAVRRRISLMSELEKSALQERDLLFFSSTNANASDSLSSEFINSKKIKSKATSSCFVLPDDHRRSKTENDSTTKAKSTVYNKVYANLRKVKQPISPGGKLTSFINSLFEKKSKKGGDKVVQQEDPSVSMRDGMQRTVRFHHNGKPPPPEAAMANHVFKSTMFRGIQDGGGDDDDDFSDASSDLFELDHKAMFGKTRFCV